VVPLLNGVARKASWPCERGLSLLSPLIFSHWVLTEGSSERSWASSGKGYYTNSIGLFHYWSNDAWVSYFQKGINYDSQFPRFPCSFKISNFQVVVENPNNTEQTVRPAYTMELLSLRVVLADRNGYRPWTASTAVMDVHTSSRCKTEIHLESTVITLCKWDFI
jgi:hypothetical protein